MNSIIEYKAKPRTLRRKQTLNDETIKTVRMLILTLGIMIIVLAVAFLGLTNQSAQKGYILEQAKLENEHLRNINENLKTKIINSTAFSKLEEKDKVEEMTTADEINYVTEEDNRI